MSLKEILVVARESGGSCWIPTHRKQISRPIEYLRVNQGGRRGAAGGSERNARLQQAPPAQRVAHAEPCGWGGGRLIPRVERRVEENEGGRGDADRALEQGPGVEGERQTCSRGVCLCLCCPCASGVVTSRF